MYKYVYKMKYNIHTRFHIHGRISHWWQHSDRSFLTLPAEFVNLMVHYIFDPASIGQPGVLVEGLERLAGAVGLGINLSVFAVG